MIKKIGLAVFVLLAIIVAKSYAVENGTARYLNAYVSPGQSRTMENKLVTVSTETAQVIFSDDSTMIEWKIENIGNTDIYVGTASNITAGCAYSWKISASTESVTTNGNSAKSMSSEGLWLKFIGNLYAISNIGGGPSTKTGTIQTSAVYAK